MPKLYEGEQAYILQNHDKPHRLHVIPTKTISPDWHHRRPSTPTIRHVAIEQEESEYLCQLVSEYFNKPVTTRTSSGPIPGVRPLYIDDDSETVGRDPVTTFSLRHDNGQTPVLSIFGGKITTLPPAGAACDPRSGAPFFKFRAKAQELAPLPGGDIGDFNEFLASLQLRNPWLPARMAISAWRALMAAGQRGYAAPARLADLGQHSRVPICTSVKSRFWWQRNGRAASKTCCGAASKLRLHLNADQVQALTLVPGQYRRPAPAPAGVAAVGKADSPSVSRRMAGRSGLLFQPGRNGHVFRAQPPHT